MPMTTRARKLPAGFWAGSSGKKSSSKKPKQKAVARSLTTTQKVAVKQLIQGNDETKLVIQDVQNLAGGTALTGFVAFSSGITSVGEMYAAIPQLSQGVDTHERVGDVIMPKSIYVDFNVAVKNAPSDAFSTDKIVHIFMLTSKAVKDLANYTAVPIGQLLDYGNGTSGGFDGSSGAAMYPVQKKSFTVLKHWKKRMSAGYGHAIGTTGTQAGTTDSVISTDKSSYVQMRIKVPSPKKLKYSVAASTYPNNFAPFFVVGWTRADVAGAAAPTFINTYVQAKTTMYYKDS